ncbi:MAG: hypothetical protein AAB654_09665, partial [Acidobacteriota bacterium]
MFSRLLQRGPAIVAIAVTMVLTGCSRRGARQTEQLRYDSDGRLVRWTSADGSHTTIGYNKDGLPVSVTFRGGWVRYGYDRNGNRIWMEDKTGATEYFYDALDRLIGVIWKHGPRKMIRYEYDPWYRVTLVAVLDLACIEGRPDFKNILELVQRRDAVSQSRFAELLERLAAEERGAAACVEESASYRYDFLGRLVAVATPHGSVTYSYDPAQARVIRRLPNGITTRFDYSPAGLPTSVRHETGSGALIAEYRYEHNAAGQVVKVHERTTEGQIVTSYAWDTRGYLREIRAPDGGQVRFDYDAMGNRIRTEGSAGTIGYSYDRWGRLASAGAARYEWDQNGYLRSTTEDGRKVQLEYEGRGFLSLVRSSNLTVSYAWDGDGNLVSRRAGGDYTYYLPEPLAPLGATLAEIDEHGSMAASYLYGDELLARRETGGGFYYFLEDGFRSVRHVTDQAGKVVEQEDYTPFAERLRAGSAKISFRMAGERWLPEIRMYLIEGRLYDARSARYFAPDRSPGEFLRFDAFNRYAPSCRLSDAFMEPRCNQFHSLPRRAAAAAAQTVSGSQSRARASASPLRSFWDTTWEGLRAVGDFYKWSNLTAGFKGGWEIGVPHPGTWAAQAERYGGPAAKKLVQGILLQAVLYELELASGGLFKGGHLPKFRLGPSGRGAPWHLGAGEQRAFGAPHLAARIGRFLYPHFYPSRVFFPFGHGHGLSIPYALGIFWPEIGKKDRRQRPPQDPFKDTEQRLGGIKLAGTGEFIDATGGITGAVYDPDREILVLVGDRELDVPSVRAEDLAVALRLVFGHPSSDAEFTLDPLDPRNVRGPWLKAKYIPAHILSGTSFGQTLFDCDWLMKQYSFGVIVDPAGRMRERRSAVPCFRSMADLSFGSGQVCPADIQDAAGLAAKLRAGRDPLSQFVHAGLSSDTLRRLEQHNPAGADSRALRNALAADLTRLIQSGPLYEPQRFKHVPLTQAVRRLLEQNPEGEELAELNRLLLGAAYPREIVESVPFEESARTESGSWARLWIESDRTELREHGNAIRFVTATLLVKAKKIVPDPSDPQGFRDVETQEDRTASQFARELTELYDEVARESPEFERLRDLAKAIAFAMWLKKQNIPVDMTWVDEYANRRMATVDKAPALSVPHERRRRREYQQGLRRVIQTSVRTVRLFGGIRLNVRPKFIGDDGSARELEAAVRSYLARPDAAPLFPVELQGRSLSASILPVSAAGQQRWKGNRTVQAGGAVYHFDGRRLPVKSVSGDGEVAEYDYGSKGELTRIRVTAGGGWTLTGEPSREGSIWAVADARGKTWVRYEFLPARRTVVVRHDRHAERVVLDESGNVREYVVEAAPGSPGAAVESGQFRFEYDPTGRVTRIQGTGLPPVDVAYGGAPTGPAHVDSLGNRTRYSYDFSGRITEVGHPDGLVVSYTYKGSDLSSVRVAQGGSEAETRFGSDGVISTLTATDFSL